MDPLVHEGSPAIVRPRASLSRPVIIGLVSEPLHVRVAEHETAETSEVQRILDCLRYRMVARLEYPADDDAATLGRLYELVASRKGDLERLFDNEVLSRGNCGKAGLEVKA